MNRSSSSWEVEAFSPWWTERIPTSSVCLRLFPTYTCEAGSSPTSTVARPGIRPPKAAASSCTSRATRARTSAATALPSMTCEFDSPPLRPKASDLLQRRVVGHQLSLAGVGREAHDDHPTRLHAGDHALAAGGMHDVVADAKLERRCVRLGARPRAEPQWSAEAGACGPAGGRCCSLAIDQLGRDLAEEP